MSSTTSTGIELGRANRTDIESVRFRGGTSLHTHRLGNDCAHLLRLFHEVCDGQCTAAPHRSARYCGAACPGIVSVMEGENNLSLRQVVLRTKATSPEAEKMDLGVFCAPYEGDDRRSRKSRHEPSIMLKVLIYGYATGVFSSRGRARKLEEDVAFRLLAATHFPSHRTTQLGTFTAASTASIFACWPLPS